MNNDVQFENILKLAQSLAKKKHSIKAHKNMAQILPKIVEKSRMFDNDSMSEKDVSSLKEK